MGRAGPCPRHRPHPLQPWVSAHQGGGVPRPTSRGSDTRTPVAALLRHRASQRTSREVSALLHDRLARTAARMKCLCMLEHKTRGLKSCVRTAREKEGGEMKWYLENITARLAYGSLWSQPLAQSFLCSCSLACARFVRTASLPASLRCKPCRE